ncbi:MAG: YhcB family protein [Marinobacter sp.]
MTNLILAAVAALAAGLIIGLLIGRSNQGATLRQRRAEQQIEELRNEYTRYQAQVNEHFMESAHLLRRFNDAFRDVNHHMARGANRLANDDEWLEELEQEKKRARLTGTSVKDDDVAEPPRDYAPKKDPEEKGTLAEDYGLSDKEKAKA